MLILCNCSFPSMQKKQQRKKAFTVFTLPDLSHALIQKVMLVYSTALMGWVTQEVLLEEAEIEERFLNKFEQIDYLYVAGDGNWA